MATIEQLAHQAFIRAMEPCGPLTIQQKLDYLTDLAGMIAGHTEESLRQTPDARRHRAQRARYSSGTVEVCSILLLTKITCTFSGTSHNHNMFNSYIQAFGEPQGDTPDDLVEVASALFSAFDYNMSIDHNIKAFREELGARALDQNAKAHILDLSFHNANENFYELEDDEVIVDARETQNDFLEAITQALKLV